MRFWPLSSFVIVSLAAPAALAQSGKAQLVDKVAAVVKGEPILYSEVQEAAANLTQELKRAGRDQDLGSPRDLEKRVLEQLVNERLVAGEIKRLGLEADEGQIDSAIQGVMQENGIRTLSDLRQRLTSEGMTMQELRDSKKKELEHWSYMNRQVRPKVKVDAEDVDRAYDQKYAAGQGVEKTRVRMLFKAKPKATRASMAAILKRVRGGQPFAQAAGAETEGPGKDEGGDIGFVAPAELQPELSAALAKLKPGVVSEPIETAQGFYLIEALEKRVEQGGAAAPAARKEEIRNRLFRDEMNRVFEVQVRALRDKANIQTYL